jgi:hypothetical protein
MVHPASPVVAVQDGVGIAGRRQQFAFGAVGVGHLTEQGIVFVIDDRAGGRTTEILVGRDGLGAPGAGIIGRRVSDGRKLIGQIVGKVGLIAERIDNGGAAATQIVAVMGDRAGRCAEGIRATDGDGQGLAERLGLRVGMNSASL